MACQCYPSFNASRFAAGYWKVQKQMGTLGRNSVEMFEVSRTAAQKLKFLIKEFFSTCDQIHRKLRIWLHLLRISLMKTFIFCVVAYLSRICEKKKKNHPSTIAKISFTANSFLSQPPVPFGNYPWLISLSFLMMFLCDNSMSSSLYSVDYLKRARIEMI